MTSPGQRPFPSFHRLHRPLKHHAHPATGPACHLTASCATVESQFDGSAVLFTQLPGKWAPLVNDKVDCTDGQTISFSKDLATASFRFDKPFTDENGKVVVTATYKVLSVNGRAITLFLNGEKRLTGGGDPLVWTLILPRADVYAWRQTDWRADETTVLYLRCTG